jgi:hypothetical protein
MSVRFVAATVALAAFSLGFSGVLTPSIGGAHSVTFDFTGTLVAATPHTFGGMLTGPLGPFPASDISGSFTFNVDTSDANPGDHHIGQYDGAIETLSFSVTKPITGDVYQFGLDLSGVSGRPVQNSIVVNADHTPANQAYVVSASVQNLVPSGPILDGDNYFAREFFLNLLKPSSEVFTTDLLPETPPDHQLFSLYDAVLNPQGQFRIVFQSGHGDHTLIGNLTSLTAVPIPAAAWLFGSALAAMAGLARRKMNAAC